MTRDFRNPRSQNRIIHPSQTTDSFPSIFDEETAAKYRFTGPGLMMRLDLKNRENLIVILFKISEGNWLATFIMIS